MLDQKEHSRIIADFEHVCTVGGIQGHFLYESMTKRCGEKEVEWVRNFWTHKAAGCPGLLLNGVKSPDTRCQAITAALIRNYVDARVIPMNTLIDNVDVGRAPTVLVIPNLYLSAMVKQIPAWRVQVMYDLLLERSIKSKPTVAYVEDVTELKGIYGVPFSDFLSRFLIVS